MKESTSTNVLPPIDWIRSEADQRGLRSWTLRLPQMPVMIFGGCEELVYRRIWTVPFASNDLVDIFEVWSFIGVDRGDIVEADIEVASLEGVRYHLRSEHKESMMSYDAWWGCPASVASRGAVVSVVCRVNGRQQDSDHPRHGTLTARVHFGLVLNGKEW